jgi:hypothetical protein
MKQLLDAMGIALEADGCHVICGTAFANKKVS